MDSQLADLSTDEIVMAIRDGDIESYRQIVVRYQGEVMKIANAMILQASDRDDLVQQVFVRVFQRLEQYETGRGFGKWVKGIARNMVREELRKRCRYRGRIEAYAKSVLAFWDQRDGSADQDEERHRKQALAECLDGLKQPSSEAVRLHYLDAKKTDEVASILGCSGGAIRTLLCRARVQLRACLESKGVIT
ncbi:MAG: sigma-70 family RNA polymerase sigma factor [Verrucomicrobiota bacterium]